MTDTFAIRVEPLTPVILGRRLNLDALLAYLLLQRLRADGVDENTALARAHTEIPLATVNGVFAGSSALFPRSRTSRRTIYGSFQHHVRTIPEFETVFAKNEKTRAGGRDFDNIENRYATIVSTHFERHLQRPLYPSDADRGWGIWFVGHGDRRAVEALMGELRYIGAKRAPIMPPEFFEARPSDCPGLLGMDGTVLRPVPCSEIDLSAHPVATSYERVRPPYWRSSISPDMVACWVPPKTEWANDGEIQRMIGV